MKLAFTDTNLEAGGWTAGPIYVRNLVQAVRCADASTGVYTLPLAGSDGAVEWARSLGADGVIWHQPPARWRRDWAIAWAARRLRRDTLPIEWTLRRAGIEVVFSFPSPHPFGDIPTLGWLPDLQHVHLPELFCAAERTRRDQTLRASVELTDRLIAMSDALVQDFLTFAPEYAYKVRV
ncbi:MAG: hypothetical protein JOZ81_11925, partial [Chloroflexi bacterium]|nr:hypothetical protein [Chloroflexota bacterium]